MRPSWCRTPTTGACCSRSRGTSAWWSGTTDTPIAEATLEPRPLRQELEFLLVHAARYLKEDPRPEDVLSTFAGIRPLVGNAAEERSAAISRDHTLLISDSGLVTITGGKWTTYRKMAQDTVDHAAVLAELPERPCPTESLRLHGYDAESERWGSLALYGTDAAPIQSLARSSRSLGAPLHPRLPYLGAEVVWAAREEMARTVEDVLARRTRALLLDARASIEAAPRTAEILAAELGRDARWARGSGAQLRRAGARIPDRRRYHGRSAAVRVMDSLPMSCGSRS